MRKLPFRILCTVLLSGPFAHLCSADSATWVGQGFSDWTNISNWSPATIPNGPNDTATFPQSADPLSLPRITSPIELNGLTYDVGCPSFYTIEVDGLLTISGTGIVNNSGNTKVIYVKPYPAGELDFTGNTTAGDSNCVIVAVLGRTVRFFDNSSAGSTVLTTDSGLLEFNDNSTGGTASINVYGDGILSIYNHASPGIAVGSLTGSGTVLLGDASTPASGRNLTIGSNNLDTDFTGTISDAAQGGSLTKIGSGKLVLRGANSYTGGTIVSDGSLQVANRAGSGTGTGPVSVTRGGVLGGSGTITGDVTVSRGTAQGGALKPGIGKSSAVTLTIQGALTFHRGGNYTPGMYIKDTTALADRVRATGVTIATGALFALTGRGDTALPAGAVFIVLRNTGAVPIAGTFDNLPDGGTIVFGTSTLQANYKGGDGNDLTLTVIP